MEESGDEGGGAAVGLGTELAQPIRFVQQLHDPLLLGQGRDGDL